MAKRLFDGDLWDKEWFMSLPAKNKCLVIYVRSKCDMAGVWSPNYSLASVVIGEKVNQDDLLKIDNGNQFLKINDGKIYCLGFIEFQYGQLNEKSPVHKKAIELLTKYKLGNNTLYNTLFGSLLSRPKYKEEDKYKEDLKEKQSKIFTRLLEDRQWLESSRHTLKIKHETAEQELNEVASRLKSFIYYLGSINDLDKSDDDVKAHFINRELKLFK